MSDSSAPAPPPRRTYGKPRPAQAPIVESPSGHTSEPNFFPNYPTTIDNISNVPSSSRYNFHSSPSKSHAAFASSVRGLLVSPRKGAADDSGPSKEGRARTYDDGQRHRSRYMLSREEEEGEAQVPIARGSRAGQVESDSDDDDGEDLDPVAALALLRAKMSAGAKDTETDADEPLEFPEGSSGEGDKPSHLPATQRNSSPSRRGPPHKDANQHHPKALKSNVSALRKILGGSSDLSSVPPSSAPQDESAGISSTNGMEAVDDDAEEETAPPIRAGTSHVNGRVSRRRRISESSSESSEGSEEAENESKGKGKTVEIERRKVKKVIRSSPIQLPAQAIFSDAGSADDQDDIPDRGLQSSPPSPVPTSRRSISTSHKPHGKSKAIQSDGKATTKRRLLSSSSERDSESDAQPVSRLRGQSSEPNGPISDKMRGKMRMVEADVELDQVTAGRKGGAGRGKGKANRRDKGADGAAESGSEVNFERVDGDVGERAGKVKPLSKQQAREMRSVQTAIRQQKQTHFTGVSTAITVGSFMSETLGMLRPKREKPLLPLSGALPGLTMSAATSVESQLSSLPSMGALPDLVGGGDGDGDKSGRKGRDDPRSDASTLLETPEDDITTFSSATRDNIKVVNIDDDDEGDSMNIDGDSPSALRGSKGQLKTGLEFRRISGSSKAPMKGLAQGQGHPEDLTTVNKPKVPARGLAIIDDDDGEELPSMEDLIAMKPVPKKPTLLELKQKALAERAALAFKIGAASNRTIEEGIDSGSDSDGFEIEQMSTVPKVVVKTARFASGPPKDKIKQETPVPLARAKAPDPKTKLLGFVPKANAGGKLAQLHNESVFANAGKQFNHAAQVQDTKHSRQAGVKDNKYVAVTRDALYIKLLGDAKKQSAEEVARRQKDAGYRPKELAPKQDITRHLETDVDADMALAASDSEAGDGDDPEDADFQPDLATKLDNEVEVPESEDDGDDAMSVVYSGAEEDDAISRRPDIAEDAAATEEDKENMEPSPVLDQEEADLVLRKCRRTVKIIADSDDEGEAGYQQSMPAALASSEDSLVFGNGASFVDDADFGGGGFSQLFGATQTATQIADDGFAGMRMGTADIVNRTPGELVRGNVTSTAAQRNAAMLQEELEDVALRAAETDIVTAEPATRYLNEQGLFTQTKPVARIHRALASEDSLDDDSLPVTGLLMAQTSATGLEATYKSEYRGREDSQHETGTPSEPLRRLKRRRTSADLEAVNSDDSAEPRESTMPAEETTDIAHTDSSTGMAETLPLSAPPKEPKPRNAFDVLLEAKPRRDKALRAADREAAGEFLQDQAEESDDDEWGFGAAHGGQDDEEEDAGPDAYVEGLVDDEEQTEEQKQADIAAAAELSRQQAELDDKAAEALHRKAAAGELRGRRRDGGVGDLDWSSDEEEGRRRRPRKTRRQARDLGDDMPEAFKRVYEADLNASDDDDEEPMEDDETQAAFIRRQASASPPYQPETSRRDDLRTEVIGQAEIQRRARQLVEAERNKDKEAKRKAAEDAERGIPAKRPKLGQAESMAMDVDTDEEDEGEESQFSIKRASQGASFSKVNLLPDDTKYLRHLASDPQAHQDSRKAGGNSSVMGGSRSGATLPSRTKSTPSLGGKDLAKRASKPIGKTGSLALVMAKQSGFGR